IFARWRPHGITSSGATPSSSATAWIGRSWLMANVVNGSGGGAQWGRAMGTDFTNLHFGAGGDWGFWGRTLQIYFLRLKRRPRGRPADEPNDGAVANVRTEGEM